MKEEIEQRLQSLREEHRAGEAVLSELKSKQRNVEETMMRISGAIQVLEELLEQQEDTDTPTIQAANT